jgi:hypothetical protein
MPNAAAALPNAAAAFGIAAVVVGALVALLVWQVRRSEFVPRMARLTV